MKKAAYMFIITVMTVISYNCQGQAGGISKAGKFVNYKFPDSIAGSKTVLFPTGVSKTAGWASDSTNLKVGEFYNYVLLDTLKGTRRVKLSTQSYVTTGAQLVLEAVRDTATRNLVVVQGSGNDTLSITGRKRMQLFYTGSKWVPVGSW
ncbi:MAG: hypothetical protein NZM35_12390 [Chitinophagales bacterium]|nr:hypothetical protein [Chitinophagales bacterium]MDW8420213.1 hypothetical protein [Chitinophagales bacterium]